VVLVSLAQLRALLLALALGYLAVQALASRSGADLVVRRVASLVVRRVGR
jgi:hypothetical protein